MLKKTVYLISVVIISVVSLEILLETYVVARRALHGDASTFRRYQFGSHEGFEDMARLVSQEDQAWNIGVASLVATIDTDGLDLKSLTTDEHGFRNSCCAAEGPPKRTFLVLGGSTVLGVGTDDAHTIPSYLNRLGQDRGWVFRNLGIESNGSTEELLTLTLALRDGETPDDVIIYHGFNDIYAAAVGYGTKSQNSTSVEVIIRSTTAYLYQKYIRNIALGRFLRRLGLHDGSNAKKALDPKKNAVAVIDLMKKTRDTALALGRAYDFRVHHFLQPMLATGAEYDVGLLSPHLKQYYERSVTPEYRELTNMTYSALLQDGEWADLTRTFIEAEYSTPYYDQIHLGPRGNELIAQRIFEHLLEDAPASQAAASEGQGEYSRK